MNNIVLGTVILASFGLLACSSSEAETVKESPSSGATVVSEVTKIEGSIEIDGSSTVYPVTEAVAEEFGKLYKDVTVTVGFSGTGGGFKRFAKGETSISDASRPIKDEEIEAAAEEGTEWIELAVGQDGLSVMVSPKNTFIECLTVEQLKNLWKPDSTIMTWKDIDASWPDKRINLYGPGTDSGTFDFFTEEIVGEVQSSRSDYSMSEDDNSLVKGINTDPNALGYFGYAYYDANPDKLKLVAIDDGNGCVEPSAETIKSGEYTPLARPLFIYVNSDHLKNRPAVEAFVKYFLTSGPELVAEVGYVKESNEVYTQGLSLVEATLLK